MIMKYLIILLALILISACGAPTSTPSIQAAYLVQGLGQLPQEEVDPHPEILVTHDFEEFKQPACDRIGLWIDKNAIQLVEEGWLDRMPQASYPIILVGSSDTLHSFRDLLGLCCFLGPAIYPDADAPGFSVIERTSGEPGAGIIVVQGFKQTPKVVDILKISNDLLDKKIAPTPSVAPNAYLQTTIHEKEFLVQLAGR
jgi:hypothetical protein